MLSDNDCDALVATVIVLVILFMLVLIFIEVDPKPTTKKSLASVSSGVYLLDNTTLLYLTAIYDAVTQQTALFLSKTPTMWQYASTSLSTNISGITFYLVDPQDIGGSGNAPVLSTISSYPLTIISEPGLGKCKYNAITIATAAGRLITTTCGSTNLSLQFGFTPPAIFTVIPA